MNQERLPRKPELEQLVLCAALHDPEMLSWLIERGASFLEPSAQKAWSVILGLEQEGLAITPTSVRARWDGDLPGWLEDAAQIWETRACEQLAELRTLYDEELIRRTVRKGIAELRSLVSSGAPQDLRDRVEQLLTTIAFQTVHGESPFQSLRDVLTKALREATVHTPIGTPTGFRDLDRYLSGLRPGQLVVIGGRPSVGKTSLLLQFATALAAAGSVLFVSYEMSATELGERLLSMNLDYPLQDLRTGRVPEEMVGDLIRQTEKLAGLPVEIVDNPPGTIDGLRTLIRRSTVRHLAKIPSGIVLDYLQLIHGPTNRPFQNRVLELAEISRTCKLLARELNLVVVAASQLSRAVEIRDVKVPTLADLRDSGAIEQDADIVLLLHRKRWEPDGSSIIGVEIAKNRNGPVGRIELRFNGRTTRFVEPAGQVPAEHDPELTYF